MCRTRIKKRRRRRNASNGNSKSLSNFTFIIRDEGTIMGSVPFAILKLLL